MKFSSYFVLLGILLAAAYATKADEESENELSGKVLTAISRSLASILSFATGFQKKKPIQTIAAEFLLRSIANDDYAGVEKSLDKMKLDPNYRYGIMTTCGVELDQATPMAWVALCNREHSTEIIGLLINYGADVNAAPRNDYSPLVYASVTGNIESVKLLLDNNADIEKRCQCGYTSIMWAANKGFYEITELLIQRGANLDVEYKGFTALKLAEAKGYFEIVDLLIKSGARVD